MPTSNTTAIRYFRVVRQLQQHLTTLNSQLFSWNTVNPVDVAKSIEHLWGKASPSTYNIAVSAVRNHADSLKLAGTRNTPLLPEGFKLKKVPKRLPKPVTETEVHRLVREVRDTQDLLLFEILLGSGLRASEAASLTFSTVDPVSGTLTIIGKGNKERKTFLTQAATGALQAWIESGHIYNKVDFVSYLQFIVNNPTRGIFLGHDGRFVKDMARPSNWVYYRVKKYTEESPHNFRHFWVTDLLNNGADLMAVMDAAGHESINTTRGYNKVLSRTTAALRSKHSREQGRI